MAKKSRWKFRREIRLSIPNMQEQKLKWKIQNTLSSAMGTKVRINHTAKKGKIEIEYYGNEDLERVLGFFNIKGE